MHKKLNIQTDKQVCILLRHFVFLNLHHILNGKKFCEINFDLIYCIFYRIRRNAEESEYYMLVNVI